MAKKITIFTIIILLLGLVFCSMSLAAGFDKLAIDHISANLPTIDIYLKITNNQDITLSDTDSITAMLDDKRLDVISSIPYEDSDKASTYYFLLDISGSADKNFSAIKQSIINWVNNKKENDRIVLLTFGESVEVVLNGTEDNNKIIAEIENIKSGDKKTNFYNCVYEAIDISNSLDSSYPTRNIFISITDGEDYTAGGVGFEELKEKLGNSEIPLYNIAVRSTSGENLSKLGELSRSTNAKVLSLDDNDIQPVFENLQNELNSVHVLTLKTDNNVIDNKEKRLMITIYDDETNLVAYKDIFITAYQKDTVAPTIEKIEVINNKNIVISFSEEIIGADNISNYNIRKSTGESLAVLSASYSGSIAKIVLESPVINGEYVVETKNIHDNSMEQNPLENNTFEFIAETQPDTGDKSPSNSSQAADGVSDLPDTDNLFGMNMVIFILFIVIAFILVCAVIILIIFLVKKKKQTDTEKTTGSTIPDTEQVPESYNALRETVMGFAQGTSKGMKKLNEKIENYTSLIERQQKELSKYKEGFAYSQSKSAVGRTIRLIDEIEDMEQNDNIIFVKKQLIYSLESNGVFRFIPELCDSFDNSRHKCVGTIATQEPDKDRKIAAVIHPGYQIEISEDQYRILIPAEVEIFEFTK